MKLSRGHLSLRNSMSQQTDFKTELNPKDGFVWFNYIYTAICRVSTGLFIGRGAKQKSDKQTP